MRRNLRTSTYLLAALATAAWVPAAPRPQGTDAPLVWPLGPDGSIARVLYSTHGQYERLDYGGDYESLSFAHMGIDIAATPNEPVYAVESGEVVRSTMDKVGKSALYRELVISRGADLTQGIRYLHLATSEVQVGDKVERDQLLGTIIDWEDLAASDPSCCYDHLHLQLHQNDGTMEGWGDTEGEDGGNPLTLFDLSEDLEAPRLVPLTLGGGMTADVLLVDEASGMFLDPGGRTPGAGDDLKVGRPIDLVAAFHDSSGGQDPPPPPSDPFGNCGCQASRDVAPCRFELRIVALDGSGNPLTSSEVELPSLSLEGPMESTEGVGSHNYFEGSVGTYTERELRFVLTHDVTSPAGAWTPPAAGKYRIMITVADAAGNTLTVPPVDVAVESP